MFVSRRACQVHYLEKMRARGARVRYLKPLWLLEEERRAQTELAEARAEAALIDEGAEISSSGRGA